MAKRSICWEPSAVAIRDKLSPEAGLLLQESLSVLCEQTHQPSQFFRYLANIPSDSTNAVWHVAYDILPDRLLVVAITPLYSLNPVREYTDNIRQLKNRGQGHVVQCIDDYLVMVSLEPHNLKIAPPDPGYESAGVRWFEACGFIVSLIVRDSVDNIPDRRIVLLSVQPVAGAGPG